MSKPHETCSIYSRRIQLAVGAIDDELTPIVSSN